MAILNTQTIYDGELDFTTVQARDVYFGIITSVPFRFRLATPFHRVVVHERKAHDVWIRHTPRSIPAGTDWHSVLGRNVEDLWSSVAILSTPGPLTAEELNALRTFTPDQQAAEASRSAYATAALHVLNKFIIAYWTTTRELFGGHALQALTSNEYRDRLKWEITFVGVPKTHWTADTIDELFDLKPGRLVQGFEISGALDDLDPARLEGLPEAIARLDTFYFLEPRISSSCEHGRR